MKLKYYLRGLGIGIIVTTLIMMFSFSQREVTLSDEEIIARATRLGMVMKENEATDENVQNDDLPEDVLEEEPFVHTDNDSLQESEQQEDGSRQENIEDNVISEDVSPEDSVAEQMSENTPPEETYRLIIQKGDVCRTVCVALAENGVIEDSEAMRLYLMEIGYANSLGPGEYDIPYGLTMEEAAEVLKKGPIVAY